MTLEIVIHNVGHGQAIQAFTPNGQSVVIDLGCSSYFSPLEWLSKDTKTIDNLIITHPHGDHIDEFLLLKKLGFTVRQFWRPKWIPENIVYEKNQSNFTDRLDAYFEMSNKYNQKVSTNELVGNPEVSGGVSIERFYSKNCGFSNINNHSGVVVFKYKGVTVVIPGDNEPPSWKELMTQPAFLEAMKNVNVFMASHHGRESGYHSDIFVGKPNLCVISDGRSQETDATNRYSYHAKSWPINTGTDKEESRYCLTTRSDGAIGIKIWEDSKGQAYLDIKTY